MSDLGEVYIPTMADALVEIADRLASRGRWLHLPSQDIWINPSRIAAIQYARDGIEIIDDPDDTPWFEIRNADDIAAITAWLEARS